MKVLTFGELMLRLKAPSGERLLQTNKFEATFGGAEANVAVSLANYGIDCEFSTILPNNDISNKAINELKSLNVNTDKIVFGNGRMGIYYLEAGNNQLPSKVIYDREYSSISMYKKENLDYIKLLKDVNWLHISGITPAISKQTYELVIELVKQCKDRRIIISCDLNYRKNLWKYGIESNVVMSEICKYVDILIANEEDIQNSLKIEISNFDEKNNHYYEDLSNKVLETYKNIKVVAITNRESINANNNNWSAYLNDRKNFYCSKKYNITNIVDRVGSGDAFAAGLIYGINKYVNIKQALDFAVAASCLKHSIYGDYNRVNVNEVEKLMNGDSTGRISR